MKIQEAGKFWLEYWTEWGQGNFPLTPKINRIGKVGEVTSQPYGIC